MRSRFDKELDLLNEELTDMGSIVESSIEAAVTALIEQDAELARRIVENDKEVDDIEKSIERRCLKLLLQQQPVASDLRMISSALKMITDMERIGDQAADISEITIRLVGQKYIKKLNHIPQMAKATIKMVRDSVDAFVRKDLELVKTVIDYDDEVDGLFHIVKNELIELIRESVENGEQAVDLLMIAKYLERIGDHAENIAEWVYYSITGEHYVRNFELPK
ncbi:MULTISPECIES: phosphate signaling complex protein PhoU [Tissierella]|jgi:phosphate transport system protein|nr:MULTISPECIES: phosphate signaling complex protein PhoU [Tissierella]MDU5082215.1 phosphate signaling complex protein PhoU [Bacillota bacterium]OZV13893.1 phosphate transport system regulatory protein PhoU [Tissierella sp. P1]